MRTKSIGLRERTWANKRLQNLLGTFVEDASGIFLATDISDEHHPEVTEALDGLPVQLLGLARDFELTLNVSRLGCTSNQNVCTIYANWGAASKEAVSVHLEVGRNAFGRNLRPFLVHELGHLWWRTRSVEAQLSYRHFLLDSTGAREFEVTEYAHSKFSRFLALASPESGSGPTPRKDALGFARQIWVEESFCETVAKLAVPDYKSDEDWNCTVDLGLRNRRIEELTDLKLNTEERWN